MYTRQQRNNLHCTYSALGDNKRHETSFIFAVGMSEEGFMWLALLHVFRSSKLGYGWIQTSAFMF